MEAQRDHDAYKVQSSLTGIILFGKKRSDSVLQSNKNSDYCLCYLSRNRAPRSNDEDFEQNHLQSASDVAFVGKCREPSLIKAMIRVFAPYFVIGVFFKLLNDILLFVQPYLLGWVITFCIGAIFN